MRLGFYVQNQSISRFDDHYVVADSRNYLMAKFVFLTPEWNNKIKTAIFKHNDNAFKVVLDADDTCVVPWEVIQSPRFGVSVFTGDLITANTEQVPVAVSGFAVAEQSAPPTPDVYTQLITMIEQGRLVGPRGPKGKQGEKGPPGSSGGLELSGQYSILTSKFLTPEDYTTEMAFCTQTICSDEISAKIGFNTIRYGRWWDFDDFPVQVITFSHVNRSIHPHQLFAIPTDPSNIKAISFNMTDRFWRHIDHRVTLSDVEPFTTVEGFNSYKIMGKLLLFSVDPMAIVPPTLDTVFDFAICLGFRLSGHNPTRGYVLHPEDGYPESSMYFKRIHGSKNMIIHQAHILGGSGTNTLPLEMMHRITLSKPLSEGERINAVIRFPVTVTSPDLVNKEIVLPYRANLLFASAGYANVYTSRVKPPEICCCFELHTEIEVDENGITARLIDRNEYEHWWHDVVVSCRSEVEYIEIISRTGGQE